MAEQLPKTWPIKKLDNNPRRMLYPYSWPARFVQFQHLWHWKNNTYNRFLVAVVIVSAPLFYMIQKATYHPNNVEKWRSIRLGRFTHAKARLAVPTDDMDDDPVYHKK